MDWSTDARKFPSGLVVLRDSGPVNTQPLKKDYNRNKFEKQSTLWKYLVLKNQTIKVLVTRKQASYYIYQCEHTFNIPKYIKNHLKIEMR